MSRRKSAWLLTAGEIRLPVLSTSEVCLVSLSQQVMTQTAQRQVALLMHACP